VSGSGDSTIKIWDTENGNNIKTLKGHTSYVSSVCFSFNNKRIVSGSSDSTIKIWDTEIGNNIKTI
jgi:WD40 repeat protein